MTIAELRRKRAALVAQMTAITAKEADMGDEALPQADVDAFDSLKASIAALDARIARLEDADAAAASVSASDEDEMEGKSARQFVAKSTVYAEPKKHFKRKAGDAGIRYIAGMIRAKQVGVDAAVKGIMETTGDAEVANYVRKTLTSNAPTLGQTTVPNDFLPDLIDVLRARTVLDRINAFDVDLTHGNLSIPRLTATAATSWGAENATIAAVDPTFGSVNLTSKKVVTRVEVSNELIARSPLALESVIRTDMIESAARTIDLAFFAGDGTGNSPIGMANAVGRTAYADVTFAGATLTLDQATGYLRGMLSQLERTNSRMIAPFWTFHSDVKHKLASLRDGVGAFPYRDELDAEQPRLLGIPVFTSTQHVTNIAGVNAGTNGTRLFLADAADIVRAREGTLLVDTSTEAGTAFATFGTVFRLVQFMDIGFRQPQSSPVVGRVDNWR